MRTSSAKQKGRRACQDVKALLHRFAPVLDGDDIMLPTGSVPGADIHLSPAARNFYPFAIECKNVESLNIWKALTQAETHVKSDSDIPLLFFKRNRSKLYVALDAEAFLKLISKKSLECSEHLVSPAQKDSAQDSSDQSKSL